MRTATLTRRASSDAGTFGTLVLDNGWSCFTGELPWRQNLPDKSCILPGTYPVVWALSPRHGMCYHVQHTLGRSDVEIHSANWMGDESLGYKCELKGCIALGTATGTLDGQLAVLHSKDAISGLVTQLGPAEPFALTIIDPINQP